MCITTYSTCHKLVNEILWICRVGFPRNSARQLADFRESSMESSQTIRRNIAGYPRNFRTHMRNDPLKGCRGTFEGDCTAIYARFTIPEGDFTDSRRRFCGLDNLWSPKDRLEDSHKTNPRAAKDNSAGSPQTIRKFLHRLSWKSANFRTDFHGNPQQITVEVCGFL